jgi:hypothetical protein
MNYTTYDTTTGKITGSITASSAGIANLNLKGQTYIEGRYDHRTYYILNGVPTALPTDPSTSSAKYTFDWTTKTWSLDTVGTAKAARVKRNSMLKSVDKVNPIWYTSLTAQQQTDLQTFRTALLNVPQQSGFPTTITWPTKPSWL